MSNESICVVISAYNEESVIASVVNDVKRAFKNKPFTSKIIVIDDHSSDATARRAEEAGAQVIRHVLNTGHGGAVSTGILFAEKNHFDIAAILDGDGQHLGADVVNGVEKLIESKSDLMIGSRLIDGQGMSKVKQVGNVGLNLITRVLFGIRSSDSQSGMRIFSEKAIRKLRWKSSGYEFCSEMLWRAKQTGLKVGEYPIKAIYTEYSLAKGQNNWNGINIVKSLLKRRISELFQ